MIRKRNKFEIYGDVLEVTLQGVRKTRLMYRANLSYQLLLKYVDEMKWLNLIKDSDGLIVATEEGKRALDLIRKHREVHRAVREMEKSIIKQMYERPSKRELTQS
jgi:predicted transcriptional regulator